MSQPEQTTQANPAPDVRGGVIAYLSVDGAVKAAEFYREAFGAEEVARHPVDDKGRTMHIHLYINGGSVMLSDAFPEYGHPWQPPQGFTLTMRVDDIQAWWERGIAAGMTAVTPVELMFWGELYGQYRDPFGILWALVSPPKA